MQIVTAFNQELGGISSYVITRNRIYMYAFVYLGCAYGMDSWVQKMMFDVCLNVFGACF